MLLLLLYTNLFAPSIKIDFDRSTLNVLYELKCVNIIKILKTQPFSNRNLYDYLKAKQVTNYRLLYAQAKYETGHFSSYGFQKRNNLYGMGYPDKRDTNLILGWEFNKSGEKVSIYAHWSDSVDDKLALISYNNLDLTDYVGYLERTNYCPVNKLYGKTLMNIKIEFND